MGFEFRQQNVVPNQTVEFTFDNDVVSCIVGLSQFSLSYGGTRKDYDVGEVSVALSIGNTIGKSVQVKAEAQLTNHNGNTIDSSDSELGISIIALTGSSNTQVVLTNPTDIIDHDQPSAAIPLPSSNCSPLVAALRGFDVSFDGDDNGDIHSLSAEVLAQYAGSSTATIQGSATMKGQKGWEATTGTVLASLFATVANSTAANAIAVKHVAFPTAEGHTATVDFGRPVVSAVLLMDSFGISYENDASHEVLRLGAGTTGWSTEGNTVKIQETRGFIFNTHGDCDSDANTNPVGMLVFALLA